MDKTIIINDYHCSQKKMKIYILKLFVASLMCFFILDIHRENHFMFLLCNSITKKFVSMQKFRGCSKTVCAATDKVVICQRLIEKLEVITLRNFIEVYIYIYLHHS